MNNSKYLRNRRTIFILSAVALVIVVIGVFTSSRSETDSWSARKEQAKAAAERIIAEHSFHGSAKARLANTVEIVTWKQGVTRFHLLDLHAQYFSVDGRTDWNCADGWATLSIREKPGNVGMDAGDWIAFACEK